MDKQVNQHRNPRPLYDFCTFHREIEDTYPWLLPIIALAYASLLGLGVRSVFKSAPGATYKGALLFMVTALALMGLGMALAPWKFAYYGVAGLVVLGLLLYLYHRRESWLYYYAVLIASALALLISLMGVEV